ncbi:MAG: putative baseplate assembly protein [Myxococcota bacterium]
MALPTPKLDDRTFQEIVDQAKRMIPRYCPEWTDHNVSDPGVTLIELFAWMTDLLLYRVNQVPDKMYVKFLELIGVKLSPPRAATVPVTFYLSAAWHTDITIPRGTEVATVRTETSPAIIFTTERDLIVRPPTVQALMTRTARFQDARAWLVHDMKRLDMEGQKAFIFPSNPVPGDAFYIGLEKDHSHHVMALKFTCSLASGAGINPDAPPIEWQVWQGPHVRWITCEVEYDGTRGFNKDGEVILHLPEMERDNINGQKAYWIRCRLTDEQGGPNRYEVSPEIEAVTVESRGGTAPARNAVAISHERLGSSDGTPGQRFRLANTPILDLDPNEGVLIVETPGFPIERWTYVEDFADAGPHDKVFSLDHLDGTLTLGPSLLQPDGNLYHFGAVPPRGSHIKFNRYQFGGGVIGNLPRGALTVLKSSIPFVARVTNRFGAAGGMDAQTLDDARLRAPQVLRTRTRAVTADDYEYLATQVGGVARAVCIAPGAQPPQPGDPKPGEVFVAVLPEADPTLDRYAPELLTLSTELKQKVQSAVDERRPLGIALEVIQPRYLWVSVQARLRAGQKADPILLAEVQQKAEQTLYKYLHPFVGGPEGRGWPFGRDLHQSEVMGLLMRVPGVEFVEGLVIQSAETSGGTANTIPNRLQVPRHAVICSLQHRVIVQRLEE